MTTATEPRIVPADDGTDNVYLTLGRAFGRQWFVNERGEEVQFPRPMTRRQANGAWSAWSTAVKDAAIDRARAEGLLP